MLYQWDFPLIFPQNISEQIVIAWPSGVRWGILTDNRRYMSFPRKKIKTAHFLDFVVNSASEIFLEKMSDKEKKEQEEMELQWIQLKKDFGSSLAGETTKEKMLRKIKENPLVPIGKAITYILVLSRWAEEPFAEFQVAWRLLERCLMDCGISVVGNKRYLST